MDALFAIRTSGQTSPKIANQDGAVGHRDPPGAPPVAVSVKRIGIIGRTSDKFLGGFTATPSARFAAGFPLIFR